MNRRTFLGGAVAATTIPGLGRSQRCCQADETAASVGVQIERVRTNEDILRFIDRTRGSFDEELYRQILGAASAFKEGDQAIGVAAVDEPSRKRARQLLANTTVRDIDAHAPHQDELYKFIRTSVDPAVAANNAHRTIGELRTLLLSGTEDQIKTIARGLSSDVISCLVKLMTNDELITVGAKVFHSLPGSQIGARGYVGARVQPNSPTDNVDDIRWQVFDAWSYGVGDVLLGTNPVSSTPESVAAVEQTLQDLLVTFELEEVLPHCVLSHVDVQATVEESSPGSTELWFQSIAGCDSANKTFDINIEKMRRYASLRSGKFGLYFETGQGADFTNGHGHGFDMVIHESRKYGFARTLTRVVADAQRQAGHEVAPWVHLNDVAGFIGPEVFRTREQLVRCCLEDIVMGKLHGLCIGLDICSTLHMDVSLSDLDWCIDQIMPANPAYLMALPTKIDPMLGYLTTGYQDHVRVRDKFGYKVNDRMWRFFREIGVIDGDGNPTKHFGDPAWVYVQYQRRKGDARPEGDIRRDAGQQLAAVRGRGVFVAEGHGQHAWDLARTLSRDIQRIYADAKKSIWAELPAGFVATIPNAIELHTRSVDRNDYILHPDSGERLDDRSNQRVATLRQSLGGEHNVQLVVSDGLNAFSITDDGHLLPFLDQLRKGLKDNGFRPARENLVVRSGRVRVGYRIGELLFGGQNEICAILHIIGERPGTGHHTFSVYITAPDGAVWANPGTVDHNITKVVSGIAMTALKPVDGADATVRLLQSLV